MDPKKLDPQDAFDLVTRREGKEVPPASASKPDIEGGFGKDAEKIRPWWIKAAITSVLLLAALALVSGISAFYWFVTQDSEPAVVIKPPMEKEPIFIGEEEAKKIIEANLRAFLKAESNEERLKYVFDAESEKPSLDVYYNERGSIETYLWKIERMQSTASAQGEIWFVIYQDVKEQRRVVSFQRQGDDYLLHWSNMKAFGDMPWDKFMLQQPAGPLMMRGYLRVYKGVWPIGISPEQYRCFLIEDREGIFSQLAVMETSAVGCSVLSQLPENSRHPVTLNLGYKLIPNTTLENHLVIDSLIHMRWQRMSLDPQIKE